MRIEIISICHSIKMIEGEIYYDNKCLVFQFCNSFLGFFDLSISNGSIYFFHKQFKSQELIYLNSLQIAKFIGIWLANNIHSIKKLEKNYE